MLCHDALLLIEEQNIALHFYYIFPELNKYHKNYYWIGLPSELCL